MPKVKASYTAKIEIKSPLRSQGYEGDIDYHTYQLLAALIEVLLDRELEKEGE